MALFNYATKEITLKVVYYGPGLSGKTTNLQYLHSMLDLKNRGKLLSLATEADRTLFFDFLPIDIGKIKDFSIRFQLYTVPGQVRYNATRRLVLKGADAVVFVADSQRELKDANIESLENMRENLIANNLNPDTIPIVLQYNKRDLTELMSIDELNSDLNQRGVPYFEAVAVKGKGVEETFKEITRNLLKDIMSKHKVTIEREKKPVEAAPVMEKPVRMPVYEAIAEEKPSVEAEEMPSYDLTRSVEELSSGLSSIKDELKDIKQEILFLREAIDEAYGLLRDIKVRLNKIGIKRRSLRINIR